MLLSEPHAVVLEREARVFTAALIGAAPASFVLETYVRGHASLPLSPQPGFDRALLSLARSGPLLARAADAYARIFARRAVLRRKLTLLVAILESSAPSDQAFAPIAASATGTLLRMAVAGCAAVGFTIAGVMLLGPLHLVSRLGARSA